MYDVSLGYRLRALAAIVENRLRRRPLSVTLELTRRCNARCDYCNHWKEQRQTEQELDDFINVIKKFQPFAVTVCGGEPFMRRDAMEILAALRALPGWRYLLVITNGWFLTDDRIRRLAAIGLDQVSVSLNFPDARQDDDRKIPGLFTRIARAVPRLVAAGQNVQLNTILMDDNLDEAPAIARLAHRWGASVMYTLYSELPGDNPRHLFPPARHARLRAVLAELGELRAKQRNIANAQWYFDHIPRYVAGDVIAGCTAGKETIHVSPGGLVRPCAELPPVGHYRAYDPREAEPVTCTRCFQACRGEVQAPITLRRVAEVLTS